MSRRDHGARGREPRGESRRSHTLDRRTFFARLSGASAVAALLPLAGDDASADGAGKSGSPSDQLSEHQWQILAAVQQHLFPSTPDAPGAREIHATVYLNAVLADPRMEASERDFIKNGIGWLEQTARETQGGAFVSLAIEKRESALQALNATGRGENWIATLLLYIFEALLCDPVYGGNPEGVGWTWLGHDPGFPRPPADKIYGRL